MVPRWRFLAIFLRPVLSAIRVQHVSDLHPKFALMPTPCVEVWQTSNLRRLRLGEGKKKEERKKKKPHYENIMVCPIRYGDHKNRNSASAASTLDGSQLNTSLYSSVSTDG